MAELKVNLCMPGRMDYEKALELQYTLQERRMNNEMDDTLLLLEHPPVITLGTRGKSDNIYLSEEELKLLGIKVVKVNRGGDVTYHGPGQIVGYPIFGLNGFGKDIRWFVYRLEKFIIELLKEEFEIDAYRDEGRFTGVWVGDKKIMAIGIAVRRWVTMHGFAFNVNTDLSHFAWINPCGLNKGVVSLKCLTGVSQDMNRMFEYVRDYFSKEFDCDFVEKKVEELI